MNTYANGSVSIWRLVRNDRAIDQCYISLLVAIFTGLLLHAFPPIGSTMIWRAPAGRPVVFNLLYFGVLAYLVFIVIMTGVATKSSLMHMSMPIPARKVWLSRILSMLAVSQLSVILVTLATAYRVTGGDEAIFLDSYTLRLGFHTGASMALLVMLLQLPSLELGRIRKGASYIVYVGFFSVAVVLVAILTVGITWASWIFLLGAALLALWTRMNLPACFSTMPAEPGPDGGEGQVFSPPEKGESDSSPETRIAAAAAYSPSQTLTLFRRQIILARILINKWNYWLDCLMLVFYSMMWVLAYYNGSRDNPWWLFAFIWIFAALIHSVSMLKKIDPLPVSRNNLFLTAFMPIVLSILIGIGIGRLVVTANPHDHRLISYDGHSLQIPKEFYGISKDGPPPVLTSRWGEIHVPESHPLFSGSNIHIYKPYDTGPESSPRFIALQIDRAVEAIHGIGRDPLNMYDDLDEGFVANTGECCFKVMKSIGKNSDTRSRVFALAGIFSAIFFALIISAQIQYGGRSDTRRVLWFLVPGTAILIVLVVGGVVLAGRAGLCEPSFVEALPPILLRKASDAIPVATGVLWFLAVAISVAGCFLFRSAYRDFEAPLARSSKQNTS